MSNRTGFFKRIKALSFEQKKVFAIALCQRMLPNYQLFSQVAEFGDAKVLDTVLNLLWQSCYDKKLKLNIEIYLERLELNTPEPSDFDLYGVYPAMDATTALIALLSALSSKDEEDLINISKLSSSTVASYIQAISDSEALTQEDFDEQLFAHPVMQDEREIQDSLLQIVEENSKLSASFIKALRKEIIDSAISNIGVSAN